MKAKTLQPEKQTTKFETIKIYLVSLCLFFTVQFTVAQTIHTVDNRPESGAMYTTVAAAITAAASGDIIQIHPSPTNYGYVTVNKTLTLIGLGHNPANADGLRASLQGITFSGISTNSVVKGLNVGSISGNGGTNNDNILITNNRITSNIQGSNTVGRADDWVIEGNYMTYTSPTIYGYQGDNWLISNNWIRGSVSSMKNTTVIINNIFVNTSTSGKPTFFSSCNSPIVANNIFLFTSLATGVGLYNSTVNFQNCMTYSYQGTVLDALGDGTGGNIDNTDPLFTNVPTNAITDFYNNDYSLTASSPGKNAAQDTYDLGIYGRLFDFDPNGRPDLSPYPTMINITNTVIAPGQNLNVDFKASIKQ